MRAVEIAEGVQKCRQGLLDGAAVISWHVRSLSRSDS
jgi:hypothetical protein